MGNEKLFKDSEREKVEETPTEERDITYYINKSENKKNWAPYGSSKKWLEEHVMNRWGNWIKKEEEKFYSNKWSEKYAMNKYGNLVERE